jgi:Putative zinc-finger
MKPLTCTTVRRHLTAYCDRELELGLHLAVRMHLGECDVCRLEADEIEALGRAVRESTAARRRPRRHDLAAVRNGVIGRIQAERAYSVAHGVQRMIDDLRMLWAAAGATMATVVCVAALLGFVRLTLREMPYSMSAVIGALADPGSNRNPMSVDNRMLLPRPATTEEMSPPLLSGEEALLMLTAVVTREGELRDLALLEPGLRGLSAENPAVMKLLDTVSQTRFQPARAGGAPVAVNVVWLLAHTTVVGKEGTEVVRLAPAWRRPREAHTPPPQPPSVPVTSTEPTPDAQAVSA